MSNLKMRPCLENYIFWSMYIFIHFYINDQSLWENKILFFSIWYSTYEKLILILVFSNKTNKNGYGGGIWETISGWVIKVYIKNTDSFHSNQRNFFSPEDTLKLEVILFCLHMQSSPHLLQIMVLTASLLSLSDDHSYMFLILFQSAGLINTCSSFPSLFVFVCICMYTCAQADEGWKRAVVSGPYVTLSAGLYLSRSSKLLLTPEPSLQIKSALGF